MVHHHGSAQPVAAWGRNLAGSGVAEPAGKDANHKSSKSTTNLRSFGDVKIKFAVNRQ